MGQPGSMCTTIGSEVRWKSFTVAIERTDNHRMDVNDYFGLSDEALLRLCQIRGASDDRPFTVLFYRHQATVWRTCYFFTRNSQDAEELVQEVFLKAYRGLASFEGRSSLATWLNRIAVNTCKNEFRRKSRRPIEIERSLDDFEEHLLSDDFFDRRMSGLVREEELLEALSRLSPDEFEVLQLRDIEQCSYAEVAQRLGINLSAAKMRVQRARSALRVEMQSLAVEED